MPLSDAASSVGERVVAPSTSLGNSYIRQAGPASNVLRDLGGPTWHIDASGTVQLTPWPSKRVGTPFTAIEQDGGAGIVEIATEDYASWLPGCTFTLPTLDGVYTNRGVVFTFDDDGTLRLEVLTQ
jgi:hypothetical protein